MPDIQVQTLHSTLVYTDEENANEQILLQI